LLKALDKLPPTLDATYNRILLEIPEDYRYDAQVIFSLLAVSARPISLGEAAEAVAIELEKGTFDQRNRLSDPCSILKMCSTLITVSQFSVKRDYLENARLAINEESKELRFAHIKKNFPGFENAVTLWQKKSVLSVPLNTLKPL